METFFCPFSVLNGLLPGKSLDELKLFIPCSIFTVADIKYGHSMPSISTRLVKPGC